MRRPGIPQGYKFQLQDDCRHGCLFDLDNDPFERSNLRSTMAPTLSIMAQRLAEWSLGHFEECNRPGIRFAARSPTPWERIDVRMRVYVCVHASAVGVLSGMHEQRKQKSLKRCVAWGASRCFSDHDKAIIFMTTRNFQNGAI